MARMNKPVDMKTLQELHDELLKFLTLKRNKLNAANKAAGLDEKMRFEFEHYLRRLSALADCDPEEHCPGTSRCPPCDPEPQGLTKQYLDRLRQYNQAAAAKQAKAAKPVRAKK